MAKVPPFSELIAATTRSAVHLETRDAYTPSDPQFQDWLAGRPIPVPAIPDWRDLVREHTARGVSFRRARVVSEPVSDCVRFEHFITDATNVAGGEEIRWLPRQRAGSVCVPVNDFWVFDDRLVRFGYFAGDGEFVEHELTDDLEAVRTCVTAFEAVWGIAVPHAAYRLA
jgi:hypothetical protein